MALNTYAALKSAIADYLDRPDLTDQIPDFITLAETRHRRDVRNTEMVTRSQVLYTAQQDCYLALPPRFLQMRILRLLTDPIRVLQAVTPNQITQARSARRSTDYGPPSFYSVHEEIEFDRAPDINYSVEMIYYAAFLSLSDANTSNGLLLSHPDVYLYGALVAAEPFLQHDERITVWAELYKSAIIGIENAMRKRRQGMPLTARVHGGTP